MYQCKGCGGRLKFDIPSQQLKCEYCSTNYDPYSVEDGPAAGEREDYDVTIFTCPQCGGEIFSTDETAAGFCSFCGASTILESRLGKKNRPIRIIPFLRSKEDCKEAYAKTMRGAIFAPKELKDKNYIDGFRGIYMPHWKYHFTQEGRINLNGKKSYRRGDYIITDHYDLTGDINASYNGLTFDASSSFADNISERLAPFNIHQMKDFTPAYLSGFYADISDVDAKTYEEDMKKITQEESLTRFKLLPQFRGFSVSSSYKDLGRVTSQKAPELTMFPVWFLSYRKGDRISYATVNGQTGKVVVDLPVDRKKYILGSLLLALPIFFILNMGFTFRPVTALLFALILSIITHIVHAVEGKHIRARETLSDDKGARGKMKINYSNTTGGKLVTIANIIAIIVALVVMFLNPVSDWYYYGCAIFALFTEFFLIMDVIARYNLLATRPLPQFNHKGGDDRA